MSNFLDQLESACRKHANAIAIQRSGESISFAKLWSQIETVGNSARTMGYGHGDTFIFVAQPGPATMPVALGLLRAGLKLAFIDPFTAVDSFHRRVDLVKPDLVIADAKLYLLGNPRMSWLRKRLGLNVVDYASITTAQHFVSGPAVIAKRRGFRRIEDFTRKNPKALATEQLDLNADAVVVFTSGTTGDPKGVVHSIASLSASFDATAQAFDFHPGEVLLCEPMTVGLVAMCSGVTWVIPSNKLPKHFDKFFGVPTDVSKLLNELESAPGNPNIKLIGMGGAPVLPSLINRIHAVLGTQVKTLSVYGMTEILPVAVATGEEKLANTEADILGKPVAGVELSISEDREILVRGPGLMKGYLGKEPNVWHPTGDLGYIDATGRLMLLGRKKNMLIRGDMNIYPSLYEPGLCTIPGVADAAIIGAPDEIGDDRVVLFLVPSSATLNHAELIQRVKEGLPKHMDQQAYPDRIEVIDSMPNSGRGQKRDIPELQRRALKLFENSDA